MARAVRTPPAIFSFAQRPSPGSAPPLFGLGSRRMASAGSPLLRSVSNSRPKSNRETAAVPEWEEGPVCRKGSRPVGGWGGFLPAAGPVFEKFTNPACIFPPAWYHKCNSWGFAAKQSRMVRTARFLRGKTAACSGTDKFWRLMARRGLAPLPTLRTRKICGIQDPRSEEAERCLMMYWSSAAGRRAFPRR